MKHTERQIDPALGVEQPHWQSEHLVPAAILVDQVLLALEKAGTEKGIAATLELIETTVSPRLRFTIPKPFKLERIETAQTNGEFLRTVIATIYALPEESKAVFLTALAPLMSVLEQNNYLPQPPSSEVALAVTEEKQYVDLNNGFMVFIDDEPVLFEEKYARLYDLFQFLLLQAKTTTFNEIDQFLVGLERHYTNRETRRQFFDTTEIYTRLKQLDGLLKTIPQTANFAIHIDQSSKRVSISLVHAKVQVSYYRGQKIQEQRMDADRWKRTVSPVIGSCGLERFIPEPQAKFIQYLQDLTNTTTAEGELYPGGWIPESVLLHHLLGEVPYLSSNPREGEYSLRVLFNMVERSVLPLRSLVERQAVGGMGNNTSKVRYRLNPLLLHVDPPKAAQPPLDFEFGP